MHRRSLFTVLCLLALASILAGCGSRTPLYAPPAAFGGVLVRVYEADLEDDHVWVKMHVTNQTGGPLEIDRDGMAVRLPDGQVLPRASGMTTQHTPYTLEPGETRRVHVDFRGADLEELEGVSLIVGGVRVASEVSSRVVGEIPLTRTYLPNDTVAPPPPAATGPLVAHPGPTHAPLATTPTSRAQATVAVDLTRLDTKAFDAIDGARLERELVVRLVQDGFAVVAPTESPVVIVVVTAEPASLRLDAVGPGGRAERQVPRAGVAPAELHLEVAQKASDLARSVVEPAGPGTEL